MQKMRLLRNFATNLLAHLLQRYNFTISILLTHLLISLCILLVIWILTNLIYAIRLTIITASLLFADLKRIVI